MKATGMVLLVMVLAACSGTAQTTVPIVVMETVNPSPTPVYVATPIPLLITPEATSTPLTPTLPQPTATTAAIQEVQTRTDFPDPTGFTWQQVIGGLEKPLGLTHAGDGSGRLFVVEQPGRIWIIQNSQLSQQPFLDITDRVGSSGNEQGLLGLAFHPDYPQNGYFFVNYTDRNGDTLISRFQVSADDPDRADPTTEKQLIFVNQPFSNHNGGSLAFGPDGYLYIGLGDGGSQGDPRGFAQSLVTMLGKILRIDVDQGDPYTIPADNPFAQGGGLGEIWAYGLRNPWRMAFDRLTGDLYIGDVGQDKWEEIDFIAAADFYQSPDVHQLRSPGGLNFGWSLFEGLHPYKGKLQQDVHVISPVAEYGHSEGCSVTGGVVYRGSRLPDWQGIYLYGDYCTGRLWGLLRDAQGVWQSRVLFDGVGRITSFGEDEMGEVYLVDQTGNVLRLVKK
jgi:glucose/arabinose dehydrogenase